MMKGKILILLTLCLGLVLLVGYQNFNKPNSQKALSFGDNEQSREVNGLEITLNDVRIEPDTREEGNQIVIVDLTLMNVRDTVYEFSTYKLTMVDQEGFAHSHVSYVDTKGILGGQLHPGRSNRGEVAFSVPVGTNYELVYTDHLRTGQVIWDVSVEKE